MWELKGLVHCACCRRRRVAQLMSLVHNHCCKAIGPVVTAARPDALVETSVRGVEGMDKFGVSICDLVAEFAVATDKDTCCVALG